MKPAKEVGEWANAAWAELETYTPPAVADLMTAEQRASVDMIIRAFASANRLAQQNAATAEALAAEIATRPPGLRAQSKKTTPPG